MTVCNLLYFRNRRNNKIKKCLEFLGNKCVSCNSIHNLEFDHIDPKTVEFRIGASPTLAWERVVKELSKCQLLCRSCHIKKSRLEGTLSQKATHGSLAMYHHHGCRCGVCKKFRRKYIRDYRSKKANA